MTQAFRVLVRRLLLIGVAILTASGMARGQPSYRSLLESLSQHVALAARAELDRGNPDLALALALEAMPRDVASNDRPYVHEAARVLHTLVRTGGTELHRLSGHDSAVWTAVFSPDGKRVLTAGGDGTARLWDANNGKELMVLRGHRGAVGTAVFSGRDDRILTASNDGTVRIWDAGSGAVLVVLRASPNAVTVDEPQDGATRQTDAGGQVQRFVFGGHGDDVICAASFSWDAKRVLTAACDGTVKVWETASGRELLTLPDAGPLQQAMFMSNGWRIVTRHERGVVRTWDGTNGKQLSVLEPPDNVRAAIKFATLSPNGERLLIVTADDVRLWNVETGAVLPTLGIPRVTAAAFSTGGARVLTATSDNTTITGWETMSGAPLFRRQGPPEKVRWLRFFANDRRFMTTNDAFTVRIWDGSTDRDTTAEQIQPVTLVGHAHDVHTAAFSADGSRLVTTSYDQTARIWDVAEGKATAVFGGRQEPVRDVSLSPDGAQVLVRSMTTLSAHDMLTGRLLAAFSQPGMVVGAPHFTPAGIRLLTGSRDGALAIRVFASGDTIATLESVGEWGEQIGSFALRAIVSPDGSRVWAASPKPNVPGYIGIGRLWDAASGKLIATMPDVFFYRQPALSADGRLLADTAMDGTVSIRSTADGKTLAVLRGHRQPAISLSFSPDGTRLLTASGDTTRIWDIATGRMLFALPQQSDAILSASFSPDGRLILTTAGRDLQLWDTGTGKLMREFRGHEHQVDSATFSPDGAFILSREEHGTARLWHVAHEGALAVFRRPANAQRIEHVAFLAEGALALIIIDGKAQLWRTFGRTQALIDEACSLMTRPLSRDQRRQFFLEEDPKDPPCGWHPDMKDKPLYTPKATPATAVNAPSSDPASTVTQANIALDLVQSARAELERKDAATALALTLEAIARDVPDAENTLRTIVYADAPAQIVLTGHAGWVGQAVFSPDGKRVLTGSDDSTARLWDAETGRELAVLHHPGGTKTSVAFSPDGRRVATGSGGSDIRLWDATSGAELAHGKSSAANRGSPMMSLVFSADGRQVLSASLNGTASVRDAATGRERLILDGHDLSMTGAVFSPDDKRILTVALNVARVWDAVTGQELAVLKGHKGPIWSGKYSPDGRLIATASGDGTARLWDAVTFKELAVLPGSVNDQIRSAVFSPDGKRLLTSGGSHGTPRIWEVPSGKLLAGMYGHTDSVRVVAFAPDGSQALSVSNDETARLWHGTSGAPLAVLRGHRGFMSSAAFSPDGSRVLTAGDRTARIWLNFRTRQELIDHACSIMSRPLSREQRRRFFLEEDPKDPPCGWHPDMKDKPPYTPKAARR